MTEEIENQPPSTEAQQDEGVARAQSLVAQTETGGRNPQGMLKWVVFGLAIAWSLFQLGIASFVVLDATRARAIHLAFALVLAFLVFPFRKQQDPTRVPWYDLLVAVIAGIAALAIAIDYNGIQERFGIPIQREVILGSIFLVLLLEATRRSLGPALAAIAAIFLLYAFTGPRGLIPFPLPELIAHRGYPIDRLIAQMYVTTEGVFGVALGVSTQFVFLFVLFGSLLEKSGGGKYFVDLANAFLGTFRGGPAKAAVVASGLTGTVSGSSLANVVTTGTFTIPLMKRAGYPDVKAAATEVAVSTNGQLMPPVMGAAAFIMSEFTGQPYFEVVKAAFIPAVISYLALFYIVHLEALKLGLRGLSPAELPPRWPTFVSGVHNLLPLAVLVWAIAIARVSPARAVMFAIALLAGLILVQGAIVGARQGNLKASLGGSLSLLAGGLAAGARNMVGIAVAVATAGIVVGTVNLTGLGLRLTEIVETVSATLAGAISLGAGPLVEGLGGSPEVFSSGTQFALVLVVTAIASLILGLGLPTTANYIVVATLTAPIIFQLGEQFGFGVPLLGAHLFVFFFGILADDTPPVGLAAYAAAAIARSNPIQTGIQGFIYDMRTAILPFMFVFNPKLLLIEVSGWGDGIWVFATSLLGMAAFAAGTQGYALLAASWLERGALIGAALLLLPTGIATDLVGLILLAGIYGEQYWRSRRQAIAPEPENRA